MPHVAFVPFTGARVHDPELLDLGLSLPGLQRRGAAITALPPLGLLTLAGMTPEGWSRSWHDSGDPSLLEDVVRARPTLVALSALTASVEEAYACARALRAEGLAVVLGGLHASVLPDEAAEHVDAVVVGEGEPVWAQVLADAEAGRLRPRYRADAPFDLGRAPLPAFELVADRPRPRFTLQTQRGCPFACSFCGASRLLGSFREKPLEKVVGELQAIRALDPRPRIELADDNTFAGPRDGRALLEALRESGARWFTESDWRLGERPELLAELAASGCVQVLVGVETLAPRYRGLGKKQAPLPRVEAALESIQEAGVAVNACFVVGGDGETRASLEALGDYLEGASFAEVQLTVQTPFPGTALRQRLAKQGRLLEERGWSRHTLFDVTYRPDAMTGEELEAGFRELLARVYSAEAVRRRDGLRRGLLRKRRA